MECLVLGPEWVEVKIERARPATGLTGRTCVALLCEYTALIAMNIIHPSFGEESLISWSCGDGRQVSGV